MAVNSARRREVIAATKAAGVTRIGSFRPGRNPSLGAAIRAFGRPSNKRRLGGEGCRVRWKRIGLRITFADFSGGGACKQRHGKAQVGVARGRFPRWESNRGLGVGDRMRRMRELYPRARRRNVGFEGDPAWWLITGRSQIGDCPSRGCPVPYLRAEIDNARVKKLRFWIGAAGD